MLDFPDPDVAIARLAPILPVFHEAFDHGTAVARRHFELEGGGLGDDPLCFASITRFHAIRVLDARGQGLQGYARTRLSNSGIQVTYAGYQLRCWKTTDGELPAFAPSPGRRRFVRQLSLESPFPGSAMRELLGGANLIIQWEYFRANETVELTLACPKPGHEEAEGESIEVHWSRSIPHPSETIVGDSPTPSAPGDAEDLDIIRRQLSVAGNESS